VIVGGLTVTVGLGVVSQAQQLINSITFFLNSLVPLTERLEEFLRNRYSGRSECYSTAVTRPAGLSAGIGYSLSTIQIFFANCYSYIDCSCCVFHATRRGTSLGFILKIVPKHGQAFAAIVKRKF